MGELPDRQAAVIGIDAYGHGVPPLASAVADSRAVAAILTSAHGYSAPHLLLDEAATRQGILRLLEETLPQGVGADSGVVIYFAGHGVARGDGRGGPEGFLLPQDARLDDAATWLPMERVRQALSGLPCRHLLVVLDCCFAGSFRWAASRGIVPTGRPLYDSEYERYLVGTAWQVLTSAAHDEKAADLDRDNRDPAGSQSHSPFASALLRGLAGEADSSRGRHGADGVMTATELYQYIFEELVPVGGAARQIPGLWPLKPENSGEFIFLSPRQEKKTRPDPPLDDANNPWLGLSAYGAADASLFFGRERVIEELYDRLLDETHPPLLVVVGASGTGKSSVVEAGLLPRLEETAGGPGEESRGWAVVRAGRLAGDPREQLAAAERRLADAPAGRRRLLFLDQFEELYTRCPDDAAREGFLNRLRELATGARPVWVVLTVRSDFEPRLRASPPLAELLVRGRYLVPAPTSEEVREIIAKPAAVRALYFEPAELVGELVDEVMAMPGALPMLSFALAEMYRQARLRRRWTGSYDRALARQDHEAVGGVVGALHRRADALLEEADAGGRRDTVRRVALRMVSLEGGRLSRRRISSRELDVVDPEEQRRVARVVRKLTEGRLVVADRGYLEPAHDTLVQAWPQLTAWLADAADTQPLLRAVWRAAEEWDEAGRPRGELWDGDPRLPQVAALRGELNRLELEFVDASGRRAREEAERQRRQRRRLRFRAVAAAVCAAAAMVFLLLSVVALLRAREQRDQARNSSLVAQAHGLQRDQLDLALLLAIEVERRGDTFAARRLLFEGLESSPRLERLLHGHRGEVWALAWNGDGRWLASGGAGPAIQLWDTVTGEPGEALPAPGGGVWSLAWSPDGRRLAAGTRDGALVWERAALHSPPRRLGPALETWAVAWSPDGATLAAARADHSVELWPVEPGRPATPALTGATDWLTSVAWSPDGRSVAAAGMDRRIRLWDAATGAPIGSPLRGHAEGVTSLAWNADGTLASGSLDGTAILWDPATGEPLGRPFDSLAGPVGAVAWGGGSGTLAVGGLDGTIVLWHTPTRSPLLPLLTGQAAALRSLAWSPDGRILASGNGRVVALWNGGTGPRLGNRSRLAASEVRCVTASPAGRIVAAEARDPVSQELTIRFWDAATGEPRGVPLRGLRRRTAALSWSADGQAVSAAGLDRTVRWWEVATGRPAGEVRLSGDLPGRIATVAWRPGGGALAAGGRDGAVSLWNGTTGEPLSPAEAGHAAAVTSLAWRPDGGILASAAADGTLRLWDGASGRPLGPPLAGHAGAVTSVAWSADGRTLAAGSREHVLATGERDLTLRLWEIGAGPPQGAPLAGHTAGVRVLAWAADGRTLAAAGERSILLWDLARRAPFARLRGGHADSISGLVWSADGRTLLSFGVDGTLMRWDVDPASWRARACRIAHRDLTRPEWERFLPGSSYRLTCPRLGARGASRTASLDLKAKPES